MPMLPSKKIFLGASALITGVVCHLVVGLLAANSVEQVRASVSQSSDVRRAALADQQLEHLHNQSGHLLNLSLFGWFFILTGLVLLLIGIYQTAKSIERLAAIPENAR
jgi:hypothetical protein